MDNLKKTGKQDDIQINIHQPYEVAFWKKKFGCTKRDLLKAVDAVGTNAVKVQKELQRMKEEVRPEDWVE